MNKEAIYKDDAIALCKRFAMVKYRVPHLKQAFDTLQTIDIPAWIPCSERLPSEDGEYITTLPLMREDRFVSILRYGKPLMPNREVKGKCFYDSDDEWGDIPYDDVIAWMPLPQPYREGE